MEQPLGFRKYNTKQLVCKLNKAIYGPKQAPRVWFDKLKSTLVKMGYTSTKSNNSLFAKFNDNEATYILIYVDDFLITRSSELEIRKIIMQLNKKNSIKDLSNLNYFLELEVNRVSTKTMQLSQRKYITDILMKAKMENTNPLPTP